MGRVSMCSAIACVWLLASGALGADQPAIPPGLGVPELHRTKIPAFPGAEGAGAFIAGGRGGKVYVVTTVEDYDPNVEASIPGSLREALEADGPRIVTFAVSGIVTLKGPIVIRHPYITIAGQTAPGDGICVRYHTVRIDAHDAIVRHMRFRRGTVMEARDALSGDPPGNVIIDHVSASWGMDENISIYRYMHWRPWAERPIKLPTQNITIQWTISSEALNPRNHAFGATWGGKNSSFHHNLFACNTGRNPSIGMSYDFNYVNNVIFNWRHRTVDGGDAGSWGNIINNYYKPGPATLTTREGHRIIRPNGGRKRLPDGTRAGERTYGKWYVAGNIMEGYPDITADNWAGGVQFGGLLTDEQIKRIIAETRSDEPLPMAPVTIHPTKKAFELVLANAGATLPKRDAVDKRVVEMVRTGKVTFDDGIIMQPSDVGGWPEYRSAPPPADEDADGMPSEWETAHGLNPSDASDAAGDADSDGYTNVEEYINGTDPTKFVDYTDPANNVDPLMPIK